MQEEIAITAGVGRAGDPPGGRPARQGAALGVALLALVAYANALGNGFAQDDAFLIVDNPQVRSLENVPLFFTSDLFGGTFPSARYYRPIVLTSFALDHAIGGANPFVYHLTNVLLHGLVCLLIHALLLEVFRSRSLALVSGALFAVHPVHTEVVTAISGRGDLLGAVFALSAALLYARRGEAIRSSRLSAILLCFGLALFSKESSLVWLGLFPLIAWAQQRKGAPGRALTKIAVRDEALLWCGLFAVTAAYLGLREAATGDLPLRPLSFMGDQQALVAPLAQKLATCAKLLGIYFGLLVFPATLSADYHYAQIPLATSLFDPPSVVALLLVALLIGLGLRFRRSPTGLSFGIAFLLITLVPISLLPFAGLPLAERYLYLPSFGFCTAVGALAAHFSQRARLATTLAVVCLLLLPASARTLRRNVDWHDDHTIWEATVEASPNSAKAQANWALSLAMRAEVAQAQGKAERARTLLEAAASHYGRAIRIDPRVGGVRLQFGLCLAALGEYERAEAELRAAAGRGHAEAWVALYRVLLRQSRQHAEGNRPLAIDFLTRAERLFETRIRAISPPAEASAIVREIEELSARLEPRDPAPSF